MAMDRRRFLTTASGMGMSLALGHGFWTRAFATVAPAQPGDSPYGPLGPPDENGLRLPEGFTSRVVARALEPVAGTAHLWHPFPDGGACVPVDGGGWIYVSNSENPPPGDVPYPPVGGPTLNQVIGGQGGVGAIRFDADGTIAAAYSILGGTRSNCAGGLTPWGTWLSCEEWEAPARFGGPYDAGRVWECDPTGATPALERPALGRFKHEMAAVDPERHHVYLSEDLGDGLLYRYTPASGVLASGADLDGGALHAMAVDDGDHVTWVEVAAVPGAPTAPLRNAAPGATAFDGGEGCVYDSGHVYLTTKGDDRVWDHDIEAGTMTVLYDAGEFTDPVLNGVDNIIVSAAGHLFVAEDGGNMEVCIITAAPEFVVAPVVQVTPVPSASEVTGLAFSPDGTRLYLNSQRGGPGGAGLGVTYEVTGPF